MRGGPRREAACRLGVLVPLALIALLAATSCRGIYLVGARRSGEPPPATRRGAPDSEQRSVAGRPVGGEPERAPARERGPGGGGSGERTPTGYPPARSGDEGGQRDASAAATRGETTEPAGGKEGAADSKEPGGAGDSVTTGSSPGGGAGESAPAGGVEMVPAERGPQGEDAHLLYQVSLALDLLEAGAVAQAARIVDQLTVHFPESRSASLFQVFLRRRHPRLLTGAQEADASLLRDPEGAARAYDEGRERLKGGSQREALLAFERAYSLDPERKEVVDSLASLLKNMGLELYSKGKWSEAISYWKRALEISPADTETLRFLNRAEGIENKM